MVIPTHHKRRHRCLSNRESLRFAATLLVAAVYQCDASFTLPPRSNGDGFAQPVSSIPLHVPITNRGRSRPQRSPKFRPMMAKETDDEHIINLSPTTNHEQHFLSFFTMYIFVPFVPSILLNFMNDNYQTLKQQFDTAAASLSTDAINSATVEYSVASALYSQSMDSLFVLLLSKRFMLYFIATMATFYAGWRAYGGIEVIASGVFGGQGEALDRLNKEILKGETISYDSYGQTELDNDATEDGDKLFATLIDENPQASNAGNALAIILPLVLASSLAISYTSVTTLVGNNEQYDLSSGSEYLDNLQQWAGDYLLYLSSLPSLILCLLFTAAEFRWAFANDAEGKLQKSDSTVASNASILCTGNVLALLYVVSAYLAKVHPTLSFNELPLDLWPLHNGVNIALAVAVTRALALFLVQPTTKSIRTIALALLGITAFDAISVFGTAANAVDTLSESPVSVMETVARSKISASSLWQPGLLEVIVGHDNSRVSDALGLGDVVFPACLVAWAVAADRTNTHKLRDNDEGDADKDSWTYKYTSSAVSGYILGSILTEIVGSFSLLGKGSGLPALVFLVPCMLLCVTATALQNGEVEDVWGTNSE
jgi:hypothetical protein